MKKDFLIRQRIILGEFWFAGIFLCCTIFLSLPLSSIAETALVFQQLNEDEYWKLVLEENSLDAYQRYMLEFPEGSHYDEAVEKVVVLRDEQAWQNALTENTPASFSRYLKIYPRGIHVEDARKKLNLEQPVKVAKNTRGPSSENPPATPPTEEAFPAPAEPEVAPAEPQKTERSSWQLAEESGNPDLFKQYLSDYPRGKNRKEAITRIPMEFSLTRSDSIDSMFFLTVRYAEKPVNIVTAEMPNQGLQYMPENPGTDGKITSRRRGRVGEETRYFFWPEGDLTAFISDEDELSTEMVISVGSKNKYQLKLEDASRDSWNIELESSLPSLELLGVVGVDGTMDTAFFTIKGGIPDYYVRIVKKGKDVNDYIHEAPLGRDRAENTWYLDKSNLVNSGIVPSGNYEVYVLDSRKLEHIKYIRPLTIGSGLLVSNMNIYTYLLIPIVLLIIWMFLNWSKKSKYPYETRRDDFR